MVAVPKGFRRSEARQATMRLATPAVLLGAIWLVGCSGGADETTSSLSVPDMYAEANAAYANQGHRTYHQTPSVSLPTPAHFQRWLSSFERTLNSGWSGPKADQALTLARNVARVHASQLGVSDEREGCDWVTERRNRPWAGRLALLT